MEAKRAEIQQYRQSRSEMSDRRERDCKLRNSLKALQFKLYEQMQVSLCSRDVIYCSCLQLPKSYVQIHTVLNSVLHCEAKTAPFYFCNNYVRSYCIEIIIGTHILQ